MLLIVNASIASYGKHYDGKERPASPLHKSHSKYGFIEPLKYYVPSIAISEIIKVDKSFNKNLFNDFFIAAMGDNQKEGDLSIHHLTFNESYNELIFEDIIFLDNRIRDMLQYKNSVVALFRELSGNWCFKYK